MWGSSSSFPSQARWFSWNPAKIRFLKGSCLRGGILRDLQWRVVGRDLPTEMYTLALRWQVRARWTNTKDVLWDFWLYPRDVNTLGTVNGLQCAYLYGCLLPVGRSTRAHLPWSMPNFFFHGSLFGACAFIVAFKCSTCAHSYDKNFQEH